MSYEIIRSETHKARKEHVCKICNAKIAKGAKYSKAVLVEDGIFYSITNHTECVESRAELLNDQKRREG